MSFFKTNGKIWVTRDKRHIPVEKLEYDHLLSIIEHLEKRRDKLAPLVDTDLDKTEFTRWLHAFSSAAAWYNVMTIEKVSRGMQDLFSISGR